MLLSIAAALAMATGTAHAQDGSFDPELFRPNSDTTGYFHVPSSATLRGLQMGSSFWVNYANDPVVLTVNGERVNVTQSDGDAGDGLIDDRLTGTFQVGMGFADAFSFTAEVPVVLTQSGSTLSAGSNTVDTVALSAGGVGDIVLTPKFTALATVDGPIGLAVVVPVSAPTGDATNMLGEGGVAVTPQLVLEYANGDVQRRQHKFRIALVGGYHLRPADRLRDVRIGSGATFGLGMGIHPAKAIEIVAEVHGEALGSRAAQIPGEALLGLKLFPANAVAINIAGGTGILPGIGSPDYRIVAGLSFTPDFDPEARDSDKDGVADGRDQCKNDPEDQDGFQDEDGCPESDNDLDGIPDDNDQCKNDPEDDDGWLDNDGCPDPDNDKDEIPDASDRCPNEAENYNGHSDEDGCPDDKPIDDTDGDGYKDDVDRCPYDAEDFDKFQDEDGCPETDNDNDGVLDADDQCPNSREIINGVEDDDGCPDEGRVIVDSQSIRITETIFFDTGKATIQSRSSSLVDEIAQVLLSHAEIKRVRIEGHTDSTGGDSANLKLSAARADAVRSALITRKVDASRLDARGFGEMYPIATNDNETGRAKNRRVEFIIVERD
jgi:outer membrane protein OmpA-like peptidoglycan-associated protein